jgi:CheY-like chemotaxis protein
MGYYGGMAGWYVLAIEHNWQLRKLIKANLEALGFKVKEAVSERHGLQRLCEGRPDLILLDIDLPGGEGLELLNTATRRFGSDPVPVVLISADPPSRKLLERAEVAGYLLKPFGVPSLLEQVQRFLKAPAAGS